MVAELIGPTTSEPLLPRAPLQPPEAVHPVVSVDDQRSVTELPGSISVAEALKLIVGASLVTVTVTVAELFPPAPLQVRM